LIVFANKQTKLIDHFVKLDKEYIAKINFNLETDTLDRNGKVLFKTKNFPSEDLIKEQIEQFKGKIQQIPPDFSRVKVDGIRAYTKAMKGEEVLLKARDITIYNIEIIEFFKNNDDKVYKIDLKINCSSGTYIRSLARDLAHKCNCHAYLEKLKRTKIDIFNLKDSFELNNDTELKKIDDIMVIDFLKGKGLKIIQLQNDDLDKIKQGKELNLSLKKGDYLGIKDDKIKALIKVDKTLKYSNLTYDF